MSYRWVEHTAELELEIDAATAEAVFAQALEALAELLAPDGPTRARTVSPLRVSLAGRDRALLLADWLDELVFRAETEALIPRWLERIELDDGGLNATVAASAGEPRPLVKGITHHRLAFERSAGGFRACVVLDV